MCHSNGQDWGLFRIKVQSSAGQPPALSQAAVSESSPHFLWKGTSLCSPCSLYARLVSRGFFRQGLNYTASQMKWDEGMEPKGGWQQWKKQSSALTPIFVSVVLTLPLKQQCTAQEETQDVSVVSGPQTYIGFQVIMSSGKPLQSATIPSPPHKQEASRWCYLIR